MCLSSLDWKSTHSSCFTQQDGPGARGQSLSPEGGVSLVRLENVQASTKSMWGQIMAFFFPQSSTGKPVFKLCWEPSGCAVLAIQSDHRYTVLEFSPKAECTQSYQNNTARLLCGSNTIFSLSVCGPQGILWCRENLLFYWNKQISWLFCSRLAWNQISCPRESRCYFHFAKKEMEKSERRNDLTSFKPLARTFCLQS